MKAFVFLNGTYTCPEFYLEDILAADEKTIIAADGGANFLHQNSIKPDVLIGDMDSVDQATLLSYEGTGVEIKRYPQEKDKTDGELAILYALKNGCKDITVYGGIGNELDHTLSNIFSLYAAYYEMRHDCNEIKIKMRDSKQEIYILERASLDLKGHQGDIVSLIPVSLHPDLTLFGFKYSFGGTISLGSSHGLRNEMDGEEAHISVRDGMVIVVKHH